MKEFITPKEAAKKLNITTETLRRWANDNKIEYRLTPGKQRRYNIAPFLESLDKKKIPIDARESVIAESPQEHKETISTIKSTSCEINFQDMKLSLILDPELTLNAKNFSNLSIESLKEISKKLWLPTKIGSQDLASSSSTICSQSMTVNSIFSMKETFLPQKVSQERFYPSLQFIQPESTAQEDTAQLYRTFLVKFYPTKEQTKLLKIWFGDTRYTYNACVAEYLKVREFTKIKNNKNNKWRNEFVRNKNIENNEKLRFLVRTPNKIREYATTEFVVMVNNEVDKIDKKTWHINKLKNENALLTKIEYHQKKLDKLKKFNIKFRKKRDDQSISIINESVLWRNNGLCLYAKGIKNVKFSKRSLKKDKKLRKFLEYVKQHNGAKNSIKILKQCGNYYLAILDDVDVQNYVKKDIIALDPGVRSFISGYNPDGELIEIEQDKKLDSLISKSNKAKGTKLRLLKKRIRNIVKDLHYKLANHLTKNYNNILLPKFETSKMMRGKKLKRRTKQKLGMLSHFKFKNLLKTKAVVNGSRIYICGEPYSTQTCGRCFCRNVIGAAKIYKCQKCGLILDRDINGARNILISQIKEVQTSNGAMAV